MDKTSSHKAIIAGAMAAALAVGAVTFAARYHPPVAAAPAATPPAQLTDTPGAVTDSVAPAPAEAPSSAVSSADNRTTNQVKIRIAADSIGRNSDVGVSATLGVVMLSGTLATQEAIDHLAIIAGTVNDVTRVDVSRLKIAIT